MTSEAPLYLAVGLLWVACIVGVAGALVAFLATLDHRAHKLHQRNRQTEHEASEDRTHSAGLTDTRTTLPRRYRDERL